MCYVGRTSNHRNLSWQTGAQNCIKLRVPLSLLNQPCLSRAVIKSPTDMSQRIGLWPPFHDSLANTTFYGDAMITGFEIRRVMEWSESLKPLKLRLKRNRARRGNRTWVNCHWFYLTTVQFLWWWGALVQCLCRL